MLYSIKPIVGYFFTNLFIICLTTILYIGVRTIYSGWENVFPYRKETRIIEMPDRSVIFQYTYTDNTEKIGCIFRQNTAQWYFLNKLREQEQKLCGPCGEKECTCEISKPEFDIIYKNTKKLFRNNNADLCLSYNEYLLLKSHELADEYPDTAITKT
jgi:hypothetical protein